MKTRSIRRAKPRAIVCSVERMERRQLLSAISWTGSSGLWTTAANWSGGAVPQSGDDVTLNQAGGIQVTLSGTASVKSISLTGDTLNVSGGTLSVSANASIGSAATLNLGNAGVLNVAGTYTESAGGSLNLAGGVTGTNLVTNPGFESPAVGTSTTTGPSSWGTWGSSYASAAYDHSGAQSLVQSGSSSGVYQSFPVTAGTSYSASIDAMTPATSMLTGNQGGFLNVTFTNASGGSLTTGGEFATVVSSSSTAGIWVNSTTSLTAPATAVSVTIDLQVGPYVYGVSGTASGTVYWDDLSFGRPSVTAAIVTAGSVSNSGSINIGTAASLNDSGAYIETSTGTLTLQPGTASTGVGTNLVQDPGFESPATTDTTTSPSNWGTWGSTYVSEQTEQSGAQSLLQDGSNSGASQSFGVTPGVSYSASINALTPTGNSLTGPEGAFVNISFSNASGGTISSPSAYLTLLNSNSTPAVWVNSTAQLIAPAGAISINLDLQVGTYSGVNTNSTAGGVVYWDNIQLGPTAIISAAINVASVSNSGTITLGMGDTFNDRGSFAQTTTGLLDSQLGGAAGGDFYGSVTAGGAASLAGTLEATLVNGYSPSINDGFTVLSYASETGTFASYQLPSGSGYVFQSGVNPTYVGIIAVPPTLTATINAGSTTNTASSSFVGANLAYWDGSLTSTQTQQLVESAGLGILRFPGGSGSDDYHFNIQNNYGYNTINTAQFAQFVSEVGATGLVTVDYGSGSPQEAEAELAWFEGSPTDTTPIGTGIEWNDTAGAWQNVNWQTVAYWASLRAASPLGTDDGLNFLRLNHSAGFINVKDWEIGNETYYPWETDHHGTPGPGNVSTGAQHDPATYALFTATFSKFVAADQTDFRGVVTGIGSASPNGATDNNLMQTVLTDLYGDGVVPGFLSDHVYMQNAGSESDSGLLNDTVSNPASADDWSVRYAGYESILNQVVGSANAATVKIMATEFNSTNGELGKQSTSLVDGIFVADSLGSLLNSGYSAGLIWDLRNGQDSDGNDSPSLYGWRQVGDFGILGAGDPSNPSNNANVAYPAYFAEQLASKILQNGGADVPTVNSYGDLETYTVLEPNGHLDLMVLNKNPDATLTGQFNLSGFNPSGQAQLWQYGEAQDYAQSQSITGASALANSSITLSLNGSHFSYSFPAYSMTVIDLTALPVVAAAAGSTLTITLNNVAPISVSTAGGNIVVTEGAEQQTFPGITSIVVNGANVTSTLNFTGPLGTSFTFQNSAGITLNVVSGTLMLSAETGPGINQQTFSAINISAGAGMLLLPSALQSQRTLLSTQTLTLAGSTGHWTATLDLNASDLVVGAGSLSTISDQLKQGYSSGSWQGTVGIAGGIISSAAASSGSHLTTLGDILNSVDGTLTGAALYGSGTSLGQFDGTSPPSTAVLVKCTYYGDANLSGAVDGTDYSRIDSGYVSAQSGWYFGDFNYDGVVDGSDYTLIDNAFNTQGAALTAQIASQIATAPAARSRPLTALFSTTSISAPVWPSTITDKHLVDSLFDEMDLI